MIDREAAQQRVAAAEKRAAEARAAVETAERVLGAECVLYMWMSTHAKASAGAEAPAGAVEEFRGAWGTFKALSDARRGRVGELTESKPAASPMSAIAAPPAYLANATAGAEMRAWDEVETAAKGLLEKAFGCRFDEMELSPKMEARWKLEMTDCDEELVAGVMLEVRSMEPEPGYRGHVVYVTVCDFGCDIGFDGAMRAHSGGVTDEGASWLQAHTGVDPDTLPSLSAQQPHHRAPEHAEPAGIEL